MTFRFILTLALLLLAQPAFSDDIYKFDPAVVELVGTLTEKVYFGPPGYGENPKTDSKEQAAILQLSKPIKVVAENSDEFNETRDKVKVVQLINTKGISLSKYFQNKIRVTGKLSSAITGHHHTDVLLEIDKIILLQ
jgi:hypothetical protein